MVCSRSSDPICRGGSLWLKGVIFGVGAWLLMMLAVMLIAGAGMFGMNLGMVAAVMTIMLHVIYGAVLGGVFAALQSWEHDADTPPVRAQICEGAGISWHRTRRKAKRDECGRDFRDGEPSQAMIRVIRTGTKNR